MIVNVVINMHFLLPITSRWKIKKKNNHLVKVRQGDNLKLYIDYFQSQLARVPSCSEEVSVLSFINGL